MSETVIGRFLEVASRSPDHEFWYEPEGEDWQAHTFRDILTWVEEIAAGLAALGIGAGDRVGLVGKNLPAWVATDYAVQYVGAIPVPIYPTSAVEQVSYVLSHSGSRLYFVDDEEQLDKALSAQIPKVERIVAHHLGEEDDGRVMGIDRLRELGRQWLEGNPNGLAERLERIRPEHVFSIIYTSGTTGPPKGVVLTQANVTWTVRAAIDRLGYGRVEERIISYLPLSHVFERLVTTVVPLFAEAPVRYWFVPELPMLPEALRAVRPTFFIAVPRVWEKFQARILSEVAEAPAARQGIFRSAVDAGMEAVRARDEGDRVGLGTRLLAGVARKVVGKKVLRETGLEDAWYVVSGAAPLAPEVQRFFQAFGLPLHQGWGMTETTAACTVQPPEDLEVSTVGAPLDGMELRLAEDREILVRGPGVFQGYYEEPEKTAETLDEEGWLHTGDVGELVTGGRLKIVDRKKDIIITAGGKNIAPQEIEQRLKADGLIGEAIVIGDARPFVVALIALDPDEAQQFLHQQGEEVTDPEAMTRHPKVAERVGRVVDEVNARLARVENVRKWTIVPGGFPAEALTPTMKLKRRVVTDIFSDTIENLYARDG